VGAHADCLCCRRSRRAGVRPFRLLAPANPQPGRAVLPGAAFVQRQGWRADRLGLWLRLVRGRHALAVYLDAPLWRHGRADRRHRRGPAGPLDGHLRGPGHGCGRLAAPALGVVPARHDPAGIAGHLDPVRMDARLAVYGFPVAGHGLCPQYQPAGRLCPHRRIVRPGLAGGAVGRRPAVAHASHALERAGRRHRAVRGRRWPAIRELDPPGRAPDHRAPAAGECAAAAEIRPRLRAGGPADVPELHHQRAGRPDRHAGNGRHRAAAPAAARLSR